MVGSPARPPRAKDGAGGRTPVPVAPRSTGCAPRHSPRPAPRAMPQAEATAMASVVLALFWATTFRLRRRRVSVSSRSSAVRRSP